MTVQIETTNQDQTTSRWQTLKKWLRAIDESMNYDPQEHAAAANRHLWQKVEQLETRINELEGLDQRVA